MNHGLEKHKCFKIIIWFVHYYFKILGESPFTHGSIHNAGDPLNTNGLEGTNYPFQSHSSELYESTACNEIEAYMMCVQQKQSGPTTSKFRRHLPWMNGTKFGNIAAIRRQIECPFHISFDTFLVLKETGNTIVFLGMSC